MVYLPRHNSHKSSEIKEKKVLSQLQEGKFHFEYKIFGRKGQRNGKEQKQEGR